MTDMTLSATRQSLREEIDACGYFPDLVHDAMVLAVGDEELVDFIVHHEPTFNHDEIHRHITVLALTPTRLIVGHTDDHPPESGNSGGNHATSSTETVPLDKINSVVMTRVVNRPERFQSGSDAVQETWLSVGWGAIRRLDLEQATCSDPQCEADHGYTGTLVADDLQVRMSAAADGADRVSRLIAFGTRLQRDTAA
jgi:Family of unknown function (DUF5998)